MLTRSLATIFVNTTVNAIPSPTLEKYNLQMHNASDSHPLLRLLKWLAPCLCSSIALKSVSARQ